MMCLWQAGLATPITSYANAGGTGDRTASITVTASAATANGTPNNLVDGSTSEDATGSVWWQIANATNLGIIFDFGANFYIDEVKMRQGAFLGPEGGNWKWQGSDSSGSGYVDLCTAFAWTTTPLQTVTLAPTAAGYRYYKLLNTSAPTGIPWLVEFEYKIAPGAV